MRDKTGNCALPRIYPQANHDHWFKDFAFLLGMFLMYRCHSTTDARDPINESSPIFPEMKEASEYVVHSKDGTKTKQSKVSDLFTTFLKQIIGHFNNIKCVVAAFEDLTLNVKLGSHSMRKMLFQYLSDIGCNMIALSYRGGIMLQKVCFMLKIGFFLTFLLYVLHFLINVLHFFNVKHYFFSYILFF